MAGITADVLSVTLRYRFQGQLCQNRGHYRPGTVITELVTAAHLGEAWWNHVKAAWRGLIVNDPTFTFESVVVEELGGNLNFGEYAIPAGERNGVRPLGTLGAWLPSFNAVGVRLAVATRATRPGQKRLPGLTEGDNDNGNVSATFATLAGYVADCYSTTAVLGAPALAESLVPVVARFAPANPVPVVWQDVVGRVVNGTITSQISRKVGRGQ